MMLSFLSNILGIGVDLVEKDENDTRFGTRIHRNR